MCRSHRAAARSISDGVGDRAGHLPTTTTVMPRSSAGPASDVYQRWCTILVISSRYMVANASIADAVIQASYDAEALARA